MPMLDGKVAIVTGAGSGVGQATAVALAREGASVVLVGRRQAALEETATLSSAASPHGASRVLVAPCDVTVQAEIEAVVANTIETYGAIDILVNNAGVNVPRRSLKNLSWEDWQKIVKVNLHGCYHCVQAVLPHMRVQDGGTLIHIGSYAARQPNLISGAAYTAAKAGLAALSGVINVEERAHGIRSTIVTLGETNTPILDHRPAPPSQESRAKVLQPEDVGECVVLIAGLPMRVTIEDIVVTPTYRG